MPGSPLLRCALLVGAWIATCSLVQAQTRPDQTGTGGGPLATITAPHTSSVGATVPRPGPGDRRLERRIDDRTRLERADDRIDTGICTGCN